MMPKLHIDGLDFDFPDAWTASKYDEWVFYRSHFEKMWNGPKAIDAIALDEQKTAWLIEVKDYRKHPRTKPTDLSEEVAHKVFDTLAALLPAKMYANTLSEKAMAKAVSTARKIRVVLHLEQPKKHSKLRPRAIHPADIHQKLRQLLKPIDAHPVVAERERMCSLAWQVSDKTRL